MNRLDAIDQLKACEAELAALRAQVAGEGWRAVEEKPAHGATVQLRTVELATWDGEREMWLIGPDAEVSTEWRPAAPKEPTP